jgi:hypothetical protein
MLESISELITSTPYARRIRRTKTAEWQGHLVRIELKQFYSSNTTLLVCIPCYVLLSHRFRQHHEISWRTVIVLDDSVYNAEHDPRLSLQTLWTPAMATKACISQSRNLPTDQKSQRLNRLAKLTRTRRRRLARRSSLVQPLQASPPFFAESGRRLNCCSRFRIDVCVPLLTAQTCSAQMVFDDDKMTQSILENFLSWDCATGNANADILQSASEDRSTGRVTQKSSV